MSFSTFSLQPSVYSLHVVAGALFDTVGRVLIAQRPPGKHMAGGWEFPGGKLDESETPLQALTRELKEELNVDVRQAAPVIAYTHDYAERHVLLDFWLVSRYEGDPISVEGQAIKWVTLNELDTVGLLEADRPMVAALKKAMVDRLKAEG